jgi:four helix bundle protein
MKENVAIIKSKKFAVKIVNLYKHLCESKKKFILSKQLLQSGAGTGANLCESEYEISKKDF